MRKCDNKGMLTFLVAAYAAIGAGAAEFRGGDDGRVLTNPDRGYTMHFYSNQPHMYGACLEPGDDLSWFPGCSIAYLRLPWSLIEPEEGRYDWTIVDAPAQRWIAKGGQIALRFTCSEQWTYYATPKWVRDAGAKGVEYEYHEPSHTVKAWDPDFGDPVFLDKLEKFIAKLAERYDGHPEVAFMDIGSYGLWGEGHTLYSSKVPESRMAVDVKRHIDLWCRYFRRTQLVISDDIDGHDNKNGSYPLVDYARSKGVAWRDDSILVQPPPCEWYHEDQAERFWRTLPVVLEHGLYEWCSSNKSWNPKRLVEAAELMHASYMSIHGDPHRIFAENEAIVRELAVRLGYRFRVVSISWPDSVETGPKGRPFTVSLSFSNGGLAPCYRDAFPCLTVKDAKGRIIAVMADSDFNLRSLMPAERNAKEPVARHVATFRLGRFNAPKLPEGVLDLYVSVGKVDGTPVYELPLDNDDGQRRYKIGKITFARAK